MKLFRTTATLFGLALVLNHSGNASIEFTGTAGTNGIQEIGTDYSKVSGIGAEANADIELKYDIQRELVLAIHDGASFSNHLLFRDSNIQPSKLSYSGDISSTNPEFTLNGALFSNSDNVQIDFGQSVLKLQHETSATDFINVNLSSPTPLAQFDSPFIINTSDVAASNGVYSFSIEGNVDAASMENANRAGDYVASIVINATCL